MYHFHFETLFIHVFFSADQLFLSSYLLHSWNNLPVDTDFSSLARFKAALKHIDLSKFLTYCID